MNAGLWHHRQMPRMPIGAALLADNPSEALKRGRRGVIEDCMLWGSPAGGTLLPTTLRSGDRLPPRMFDYARQNVNCFKEDWVPQHTSRPALLHMTPPQERRQHKLVCKKGIVDIGSRKPRSPGEAQACSEEASVRLGPLPGAPASQDGGRSVGPYLDSVLRVERDGIADEGSPEFDKAGVQKPPATGGGANLPSVRWNPWAVPPGKRRRIVQTESHVRRMRAKRPEPECLICEGSGKVECDRCCGRGRLNYTDLAMLPKGEWPQWCWTCRGSGLAFCSRCLGTGERRGMVGFRMPEPGDPDF